MTTPSFDYATRLADLAFDLDNDKELLPEEHRESAYITVLAMESLALSLHPSIFDEEPEEPVEVFSPHTTVIGNVA